MRRRVPLPNRLAIAKQLLIHTHNMIVLKMPIKRRPRRLEIIIIANPLIARNLRIQKTLNLRFRHRCIIPHLIIRNNISRIKITQVRRKRPIIIHSRTLCKERKQPHRHKHYHRKKPNFPIAPSSHHTHIVALPEITPLLPSAFTVTTISISPLAPT